MSKNTRTEWCASLDYGEAPPKEQPPVAVQRGVVPHGDDIQEAYSEAADHLEACSGNCSVWDNPEQMRAAYKLVAERIRAAAKRAMRRRDT